MGAETNVVRKVVSYLDLPTFKVSISGRFLVLPTGMQLGDVTVV